MLRTILAKLAIFACLSPLLLAGFCWAQPGGSEDQALSGPDVYLLPDQDGKLRKVLGFDYGDFIEAWRASRLSESPSVTPLYAIQTIAMTGEAVGHHVRLRIVLEIRMGGKEPVEVPLRLGKLIIEHYDLRSGGPVRPDSPQPDLPMADVPANGDKVREDPVKEPDSDWGELLVFDSKRDGYVAWLHGNLDQVRTLVIEGLVPISRSGDEYVLQLVLPGTVKSSLKLHVPTPDATGHVTRGEVLKVQQADGQGTNFLVEGMMGLCKLHWRSPQAIVRSGGSKTLVTDEIAVTVDPHHVLYDVLLHVSNLYVSNRRRPTDRFEIRLPPGSALVGDVTSSQVQLLPMLDSKSPADSTIVEVRLRNPSREPFTIHLRAEQRFDDDQLERVIDMSGPQFVGAVRQSGHVSLTLDAQLQAYFDLKQSARQIELTELPERLRSSASTAAFFHARSQWNIRLHTRTQATQVRVQPDYALEFTQAGPLLKVQFDYQVTGTKMFALRIAMHGWKLTDDPIESGGAVDLNRIVKGFQDLLVLHMAKSEARQFKVRFTVRRERGIHETGWPMPMPKEAFVLPGNLSVKASSSLEVKPLSDKMVGLVRQENSLDGPRTELGDSQSGQTYSYRMFKSDAVFHAEVAELPRRMAVDVENVIRIDRTTTQVAQSFQYRVDYQPVRRLLLMVPATLLDNETLAFFLDQRPIVATPTANHVQPDDSEMPREIQVALESPRLLLGDFEIGAQVRLTFDLQAPAAPMPLPVPLSRPVAPVQSSRTIVHAAKPLQVSLLPSDGESAPLWSTTERLKEDARGNSAQRAGPPSDIDGDALTLFSDTAPNLLPLEVHDSPLEAKEKTNLERIWYQTWFLGGLRQERAVFRFRTEESAVTVQLPPGVAENRVEVLLDRTVAVREHQAAGRLAIRVESTRSLESHTLEVRYQIPEQPGRLHELQLIPVRLESRQNGVLARWQLLLPGHLHAVTSPAGFAAEYRLGWNGIFWGREPTQLQSDLQRWTMARIAPPPPKSVNQYLFTAFQVPHDPRIIVIDEIWIVIASSAAVFCLGLLLLATPVYRSGLFWLVLAIGNLGLAALKPEIEVVLVQALCVGGAMILLAALLRKILLGPTEPRPSELAAPIQSGSSAMATKATSTEPWVEQEGPESSVERTSASSMHPSGSAP